METFLGNLYPIGFECKDSSQYFFDQMVSLNRLLTETLIEEIKAMVEEHYEFDYQGKSLAEASLRTFSKS